MQYSFLTFILQLVFTGLLLAAGHGADGQTISLRLEHSRPQEVFKAIEQQAGVNFVYKPADLHGLPSLSLNIERQPLAAVLRQLEKLSPLSFRQSGKMIAVSKQDQLLPVMPARPKQVQKPYNSTSKLDSIPVVRGRVLDTLGFPLVGATIRLQGSKKVTHTNQSGTFNMETIPETGYIEISYVGFTQRIVKAAAKFMEINMEASTSSLDETVVIGYGTTTKRLNTASVSTVTAADIEKQPVTNVLAALAGRVPGMKVAQQDGLPGGSFDIVIQGKNSLSQGYRPLILIDGIPFTNETMSTAFPGTNYESSPLNILNPNNIERVEVLKDADATAIYGSRGSNGVILITSKKGKAGKTALNVNAYTGLTKATVTADFMNTKQYLQMRREAFKNDGIIPTASNAPDLLLWDTTRYIDWNREFRFDHANSSNVQLDFSGGSKETQYLIGASFHKETPLYAGLAYKYLNRDFGYWKGSVNFNLHNSILNDRVKTSFTAAYATDKSQYAGGGTGSVAGSIDLPPNAPYPLDDKGNLVWSENGASFSNPLAIYNSTFEAWNKALTSSFNVTVSILEGLDFKINAGYNDIRYNDVRSNPLTSLNPSGWRKLPYTMFYNKEQSFWQAEPILTYQTQLGPGRLEALAGMSWHAQQWEALRQDVADQSDDRYVGTLLESKYIVSYLTNALYKYHGMYSRINYNIRNKYIINLTGRRDGSSRFGSGKRYANFGAAGLAYIFSEERLVKEALPWLSFGKFRTNYGITGNDNIGDYMFYDAWSAQGISYSGAGPLVPQRLSNDNYNWERNNKFEAAMELGFMDDRLLFTVNYYRSMAGNQLINYTLPSQTGFSSVLKNFEAKILNEGWEWTLTAHPIKKSGFDWTILFNATTAVNRLYAFPGLEASSYASRYVVGESIDNTKYYAFTGIDQQTGVYTYTGTSTADRTILKNSNVPRFYGGFTNSLQWKRFSADVLLQYAVQNRQDAFMRVSYAPGTMNNQPTVLLDRWKQPGDEAKYQRYTTTGAANTAFSQYKSSASYIVDGSYIRIKNVSIAYNLGPDLEKLVKVKALRVYLQGQNLGLITGYKGADPESGGIGNPLIRVYTAGLQITF